MCLSAHGQTKIGASGEEIDNAQIDEDTGRLDGDRDLDRMQPDRIRATSHSTSLGTDGGNAVFPNDHTYTTMDFHANLTHAGDTQG
jgi:hypothetical protein